MTARVPLVVCGAGGHARACLDTVMADPGTEVLGAVGPAADGPLQVPYLGDDAVLDELWAQGVRHAFVAVGSNRVRLDLVRRLVASGWQVPAFVAASAVLSPSARLGAGSLLMPGSVVNAYAVLGDAVVVNTGASVDHDCVVGDGSHVAPGSRLAGGVRLGEGTLMGVASAALPGTTVGDWATVGGGGVVVRDIPSRTVAVGLPAVTRP